MKIKVLLLVAVAIFSFKMSNSQSDTFSCAYDTLLYRDIEADPRLKNAISSHLHGAQRFREKNPNLVLPEKPMPEPPCDVCLLSITPGCYKTKYILPVIYHIVHYASDSVPGTGSNVSEALVQSSVSSLNKRFAGYGQLSPAANTGIQFFLAPVGPDSNGIIRYPSSMSNHSTHDRLDLLNLIDSQFRYGNYINVFVVDQINNPKVAGYATNPRTTSIFFQMITVIGRKLSDYNDCQNCGLDTNSRGKLMSHEMGHYLGLLHTFAGNCSGTDTSDCATKGDGCCDTPPVNFGNITCPDSFFNSCTETPVDLPDQIENDMDYAPETCAKWLTRNQAEIMHYTLETYRRDLIDPELLFQFNPEICFLAPISKPKTI